MIWIGMLAGVVCVWCMPAGGTYVRMHLLGRSQEKERERERVRECERCAWNFNHVNWGKNHKTDPEFLHVQYKSCLCIYIYIYIYTNDVLE